MMAFVLDADGGEEMVASSVPLRRIGRPEDAAGTITLPRVACGLVPDRRGHPRRRRHLDARLTRASEGRVNRSVCSLVVIHR